MLFLVVIPLCFEKLFVIQEWMSGADGYRINKLNDLNSELVNTILKNQLPFRF